MDCEVGERKRKGEIVLGVPTRLSSLHFPHEVLLDYSCIKGFAKLG